MAATLRTGGRLVFVVDTLHELSERQGSTLHLMECADRLGIVSVLLDLSSVAVESTEVGRLMRSGAITLANGDVLVYRANPPYAEAAWKLLQVLASACECYPTVHWSTPLSTLATRASKLEVLAASPHCPPSVVTSSATEALRFLERHRSIIVKPLASGGGSGNVILRLDEIGWEQGAAAVRDLFAAAIPLVAQALIASGASSVLRLVLLDGCVIAGVLLTCSGAVLQTLSVRELQGHCANVMDSLAALSARLRSGAVRLATVELVEGFVIDVNFCSPGLLRECEVSPEWDVGRVITAAFSSRRVLREELLIAEPRDLLGAFVEDIPR